MVRRSGVLLVVLLLLAVLPCCAARPQYPCYRPTVAPVIDGEVAGDPAWQNTPFVTGFSILGNGYTMAKQTTAQACWDDQAFYVAVTCEEPDAPRLRTLTRDGGNFWEDDGLEIFLQPGALRQVYQFGVTAAGARGSAEGYAEITKFTAAAKMGNGVYSIELRVPYSILLITPKVGDVWYGNICRNTMTKTSGGDQFTSWAPLANRFLEPDHFGVFKMSGLAPGAADVAKTSAALNQPYRERLTGLLQTAAAQGDEYRAILSEAAAHPKYAKRATNLRLRWWHIKSVCRKADQAPVLDLRRALMDVEALVRESYQFKWSYMIATVLPDS
jgi:hypothetical protein